MPNLYIISGCNGAGKTTASYSVLPEMLACKEFVNADEIAKGLSPFHPDGVAIEAGRIMLQRIDELMNKGADFAIETTLATKSYVKLIDEAHAKSYFVTLIYFWLNTPDLAVERVKERVKLGGHHIPEDVIRRRYIAGARNLKSLFIPVCDYWILIDNSVPPFKFVAEGNRLNSIEIKDEIIYTQILNI
jgi:predicted ABC-type ATPase